VSTKGTYQIPLLACGEFTISKEELKTVKAQLSSPPGTCVRRTEGKTYIYRAQKL